METLSFRAMNTSVLLAVDGEPYAAVGLQEARSVIEQFEKRFSRFLPDSELSQLNASHGAWTSVSPELFEMLDLALSYYQDTNGLFDPSILPNLKRLGYDRSMDQLRKQSLSLRHSLPFPRLVPLHVRSGAVATSSIAKRAWTQGTESRHHLIDPRTGQPAVSDWLSVTVFSANIVQAEVFAKAILIGGAGAADAMLAHCPEVAYLAVDRDGRYSRRCRISFN